MILVWVALVALVVLVVLVVLVEPCFVLSFLLLDQSGCFLNQ